MSTEWRARPVTPADATLRFVTRTAYGRPDLHIQKPDRTSEPVTRDSVPLSADKPVWLGRDPYRAFTYSHARHGYLLLQDAGMGLRYSKASLEIRHGPGGWMLERKARTASIVVRIVPPGGVPEDVDEGAPAVPLGPGREAAWKILLGERQGQEVTWRDYHLEFRAHPPLLDGWTDPGTATDTEPGEPTVSLPVAKAELAAHMYGPYLIAEQFGDTTSRWDWTAGGGSVYEQLAARMGRPRDLAPNLNADASKIKKAVVRQTARNAMSTGLWPAGVSPADIAEVARLLRRLGTIRVVDQRTVAVALTTGDHTSFVVA